MSNEKTNRFSRVLFCLAAVSMQGIVYAEPELNNVALASAGTEIDASDSLAGDVPGKLIDGVINHQLEHRWHSDIVKPHPHWLKLKFLKPLPLRRVVFHASTVACFPTQVAIEMQEADGKIRSLVNTPLTPAQAVAVELPAVTTDNLKIHILDSNAGIKGYVQLNAVEVLASVAVADVQALAQAAANPVEEPETGLDVALAENGARADVSSIGYFGRNHPDYRRTDMASAAGQLIDGRHISLADALSWPTDPKAPAHGSRWISQVDQPNPHWAWIRFNGLKRIDRVVLRCSLLTNYPTDFRGEYSPDNGKTFKTLFAVKDQKPDSKTLVMKTRFAPVVADNFRLVIERSVASSPAQFNTQLSEIEVYGADAGGAATVDAQTKSDKLTAALLRPDAASKVIVEERAEEIEFRSPWQRVVFARKEPRVVSLCWDNLGKGELGVNLLNKGEGIAPRIDLPTREPIQARATLRRDGNTVKYGPFEAAPGVSMLWEIKIGEKSMEMAVATQTARPLVIRPGVLRFAFDAGQTLTTPFYTPQRMGYVTLPAVFHAPDFGTTLVTSPDMAGFRFLAGEYATPDTWVRADLTPVLPNRLDGLLEMPAGTWKGSLTWTVEQITPVPNLVSQEPRLQKLPRYSLNGLQFRPDQNLLCNQIVSINCPFCLWEYAEVAQWLPVLPGGIDPVQMLKITLDRYIAGTPGHTSTEWPIFSDNYSATGDTPMSFICAMWTYVLKTGDKEQLTRWLPALDRIVEMMEKGDLKGDGLLYTAGKYVRSAGWHDTMAIRGLEASMNLFCYRAFQYADDLYRLAGQTTKAENCVRRAAGIKKAFVPALLSPKTGVIAGGILDDGTIIDSWYVWVNGMAICYGVVEGELANQILDRFQAKFKEVGYTRFENGLPNVLEPIPCPPQVTREDGSPHNSFQQYLNGGACPAWSGFFIQALYQTGRKAEADAMFWPLMQAYGKGRFNTGSAYRREGLPRVDSGKLENAEWWYWDGRPQTAEGYLVDMYQPVAVLWTGYYGLEFTKDGYRTAPWSPLKKKPIPLGLTYMGREAEVR